MTSTPGDSTPMPGAGGGNLASFDRLLAELAAGFIGPPREPIDRALIEAQHRIGAALALDRVALWLPDPQGDLTCGSRWSHPGVPAIAPGLSAHDHFPWMFARVRAGDIAPFARLADLPDAVDRASHARLGTRSGVAMPLVAADRLEGAISFDTVRAERPWLPATLDRLHLAAILFANVLARRRSDDILRSTPAGPVRPSTKLVDVERQHIASVLESTRWRIRGEHGAAVRLGLKPTTLETRMAKLGLHRPRTWP